MAARICCLQHRHRVDAELDAEAPGTGAGERTLAQPFTVTAAAPKRHTSPGAEGEHHCAAAVTGRRLFQQSV